MIEPRELRLGNYVLHELFGAVEIIAIYKNSYDVSRDGKTKEWFAGLGCKPIPLSEGLLVAAGFDKCLNGYWSENDRLNVKISKHDVTQIFLSGSDTDLAFSGIEFVHQLQNLFYSLCGEELSFDLSLVGAVLNQPPAAEAIRGADSTATQDEKSVTNLD